MDGIPINVRGPVPGSWHDIHLYKQDSKEKGEVEPKIDVVVPQTEVPKEGKPSPKIRIRSKKERFRQSEKPPKVPKELKTKPPHDFLLRGKHFPHYQWERWLGDLGYDITKQSSHCVTPHKKPRAGMLSDTQRWFNKRHMLVRSRVERLFAFLDIFRLFTYCSHELNFLYDAMVLACSTLYLLLSEDPQYSDCFTNLSDDQIRGLGTTECHCSKAFPSSDRLCTVDPSSAKEDIRQQMEVHMPLLAPRLSRNRKKIAGPSPKSAFWERKLKKPYEEIQFGPKPKPTTSVPKESGATKGTAIAVNENAAPMPKTANWRFQVGEHIDSQAVVAALQRHGLVVVDSLAVDRNFMNKHLAISRGVVRSSQVALVLRAGQHFIGGVAYEDVRRKQILFLLWDSAPPPDASEGDFARRRGLQLLHRFMASVWLTEKGEFFWMQCARQDPGSGDCGIHTVNNILQHVRETPVKKYDRLSLGEAYLNEPPPDTEKELLLLSDARYEEWKKAAQATRTLVLTSTAEK